MSPVVDFISTPSGNLISGLNVLTSSEPEVRILGGSFAKWFNRVLHCPWGWEVRPRRGYLVLISTFSSGVLLLQELTEFLRNEMYASPFLSNVPFNDEILSTLQSNSKGLMKFCGNDVALSYSVVVPGMDWSMAKRWRHCRLLASKTEIPSIWRRLQKIKIFDNSLSFFLFFRWANRCVRWWNSYKLAAEFGLHHRSFGNW